MFKSLMLTALCVAGVGSPVISSDFVNNASVVSRSMSSNQSSYHIGDKFRLAWTIEYDTTAHGIDLFLSGDSGINCLKFSFVSINASDNSPVIYSMPNIFDLFSYDYCIFYYTFSITNKYTSLIELDDNTDETVSIISVIYENNSTYDIVIDIIVTDTFSGFSDEALPYLTKIDNGYVAPQKNNLYRYIYDFYYSLFSDTDTHAISTSYNMPFDNWLCHSLTIITLLVGVFVLFIFLKWLFKVISGLILLK